MLVNTYLTIGKKSSDYLSLNLKSPLTSNVLKRMMRPSGTKSAKLRSLLNACRLIVKNVRRKS